MYYPRGDFEGAALVRVNPRTLQPIGRVVRLGDSVSSRSFSPDRRTLAFGGDNFGEVVFVDVARGIHVTQWKVAAASTADIESNVEVEAWPSPSRLIAVTRQAGPWWAKNPSKLLVLDPQRRKVVRRMPLRGGVDSVVTSRGTTAVLTVRGRYPEVVVLEPDGETWARRLRGIDLDSGKPARVRGRSFPPTRIPAIASDGSHVFVAASDRPIADIDLRTHVVRYHFIRVARRYLAVPPAALPGSGGVNYTFFTGVELLHHELAVFGYDELPTWVDGEIGHRFPPRMVQIVDTRRWRVVRTVRAQSCEEVRAVTLCDAAVSGFAPDNKGSRGPILVAYDSQWRRLFVKPKLWWTTTNGRLFGGAPDGTRVWEFGPSTGRAIRAIKPSPLNNQMWPLDLFTWR